MSSSPVAVAASDPGGGGRHGEPKQKLQPEVVDAAGATAGDGEGSLAGNSPPAGDGEGSLAGSSPPAGDADVTMTEASEEVDVVAEVKVEGKAAVAGDAAVTAHAVGEGGDAAAGSDPLYATESAGMLSGEGGGDESIDGARGLDGGHSDEEKLEAEAGGSQGVAERKPVPAGDVALAGEVVEAPGSATSEHTEAESTELRENSINANPAVGSEGKDNGVAHCDKDIQNSLANVDQCARYCLPPLDNGGFRVSDLVWGKVKSHPWWPGEIFDPSDASELALKHQKKGNRLVAYYGDNSFAWCDESQLKPFVTNYSQMEKQSSSDAFVSSVNYALEELSRRILSGMSCSCLPEELSDNGMSYMVENAGLKDGVTCSAVNRSEILTCFSPESLLHYIKSLALFPGQGGDLLELVIACSQLTSFYRSKGCPELASFQTGSAWAENDMGTSSTKNVMVEEAVTTEVRPSDEKPKRGRGRPRKQKPEDDLELTDKKATSYGVPLGNKMVMDFDGFDDLQNKKKRSLDSFEDSETKSTTPTFGSSFKIGECIRRAASQLTGPSSIVKSQIEPTVYKNTAEAENGEFDISSDDAVNELAVEKRAKRRRMHRHHIANPKELLLHLCSVALEPMNGYSFSAMIISYFSDYRNYIVSTTTEANIIEKSTSKRGRKKRGLPSSELETTDHMQDSYWSGLSLHNHPIHNLGRASTNTRPRRRRRSSQEIDVPSAQHPQLGTLGPKKQIQVIERSIIHVDEKMVDECKPTALVLSFGRSTALPSETELIKMFGRYGPLKESETEVQKSTNTVKVVFKKRVDAERAFSVAGKYGTFGPSLRSYRLANMPFSLGLSEASNPEAQPEDHGLDVPGRRESEVPLHAVQVDEVDKAEAVKESSGEQVETVKLRCQAEAADNALVDQGYMVEKTGQIDAELTARYDQIGTAAHNGQAQSIAGESSEQVNTIKEAYAQDEASLKDRSEIVLSGDATGASNGGTVDEIQLGKAPNQASAEVPSNTLHMEAVSEAQSEDTIKQTSYAEATNEVSAEVLSDNIQVDVVAEAPKQGHVCGDNAVSEAVAKASIIAQVDTVEQTVLEASAEVLASTMQAVIVPEALQGGHELSDALCSKVQTEETVHLVDVIEQSMEEPLNEDAKDVTEADTENEIPEETRVSLELQAQSYTEKPVEQDATEKIMQFQAPREASAEIPCDAKLEVEALTAEPVGQVATEEVKVPMDESATVLSDDVPADISEVVQPETAQVQAVCQTSLEQQDANAEADTVEDLTKASAQKAVSSKQIVESKTEVEVSARQVRSDEQTVQVEDVTEASGGHVEVGKQTAEDVTLAEVMVEGSVESNHEAPVEETVENKAAAERVAGESAEGKTTAEAQDDKMENKAITEALSGEIVEGETAAAVPNEKAGKASAEALAGETAEDETTAEAPDEQTTTSEKIVEDATVEAEDEKITTAKKTLEDATVEVPDEKTDASVEVEAPDEEAKTANNIVLDATVEALDKKGTTAEKPIEDSTVEAPDEIATTAEDTVEDATVEAPDEIATTAEDNVEDATVEAPDEKATIDEDDASVEVPDGQAGVTEQTG